MKCRVKNGFSTNIGKTKVKVPKNQIGLIKGIIWGETKKKYPELDLKDNEFYYLADFPEGKGLIISTREGEIE